MIFGKKDKSSEEVLSRMLDFFSGVFFGVAIFGGLSCFFILKMVYPLIFAILIGVGIFCVFLFFGLVAKSLAILVRNPKNT